MEEKLLKEEPKTAAKAPSKTTGKAPVANNRKPNQSNKMATKPPVPDAPKTYRR
jgi:hypothetical protein